MRATVDHDLEALVSTHNDLEGVGEALLAGDPEFDLEKFDAYLSDTSRLYINQA
ncbi:MAG: hypothetical protein ACI9TH_005104 [Kiritimatiellia bacterium]